MDAGSDFELAPFAEMQMFNWQLQPSWCRCGRKAVPCCGSLAEQVAMPTPKGHLMVEMPRLGFRP
jgi:hypothetical protein